MTTSVTPLTPYDDAYATCERAAATLCIYSGQEHPSTVTAALGINPTRVALAEEASSPGTAQHKYSRKNGWFLESEGTVLSLDLRRHLDWLLEIVESCSEKILALQALPGFRTRVSCVWWSAHGHGGPTLWPVHMQRLAALNLELGFDIYFFGDEEGGKPKTSPELWQREPRSRRPTN